MFPFLGELIGLVALLIQRGCTSLKSVVVGTPAQPDVWNLRTVGSCNSTWPASAAHRLANGPPWDWSARLFGEPDWSAQLVTVSIPSRRSFRG